MLTLTTKFRKSLVISTVLVLLFTSVQSVFAQSTTKGDGSGEQNTIFLPMIAQSGATASIREAYAFPVQPGTDAWAQLETHDAMVEAAQAPLDVLQTMTTNALVETVLQYPLLGDIFAYDSPQKGLDAVASEFDGLIELINRPDAATKLFARYQTMDPNAVGASATLEEQGLYDRQLTFVETLLSHEAIQAKLTDAESTALIAESLVKFDAKQKQAELYGHFGRERTALLMGRSMLHTGVSAASVGADQSFLNDGIFASNEVIEAIVADVQSYLGIQGQNTDIGAAATEDYYSYVYTPRRSAVRVIVMTYELSSAQIAANNSYVARNYPRAARLSNASRRYNCHSYAWYYASTANTRWMNSPGDDRYMTDGSYRYLGWAYGTYVPNVPNGTRVSYPSSSDHSAIKVSSTSFQSKWGQLPIMRHAPNYSPYGSSRLYYYYR